MIDKDEIIRLAARKFLPAHFDWRILKALVWQESRLNAIAVSPVGARGAAQIMPKTWDKWSKKAGHDGADPYDFKASVETGACYLNWLYGQWTAERPEADRIALALASYNAGLGHILHAQRLAGGVNDYKSIANRIKDVTGQRNAYETVNYSYKIFNKFTEYVLGWV